MAAIKLSTFFTALLLTQPHDTLLRNGIHRCERAFAMNLVAVGGTGGGAVYDGNARMVGVGAGNLRYSGTYIDQGALVMRAQGPGRQCAIHELDASHQHFRFYQFQPKTP
ncbi:hypothetical protein A1D31_35070 [Bradyrhizobium liaoningense]|nr:hypothetical protein A1D31_35070 [Bradyrhizobium liaoningense]